MPHQFKIGISHQMADIFFATGKEIIDAQYLVPLPQQALAKMRPQKPITARNQDFFRHRKFSF
jgi:hypothetical protein